jgi:YVTN family beta-propeller protein
LGNTPVQVAISPNGALAYAVNQGSNNVSVIDTATESVTATIGVGNRPYGVAFSPDGGTAYVANTQDDTVSVISTASNSVTGLFAAGSGPTSVALPPNGTVAYVANQFDGTVTVHAIPSGLIVATVNGFSHPNCLAVTPDGASLVVTNGNNGTVSVLSTAANTVAANIPTASLPVSVAISTDGTEAYVVNEDGFSLSIISTSTWQVINTVARVGTYPIAVAVVPAPVATPACSYAISPGNASFSSTGGTGSVSVKAAATCPWSATSQVNWANITAGGSGSGNGTVSYTVAANLTPNAQTGSLTIGGQTFTIAESGAACSYALSSTGAMLGSSGGAGTVVVTAPSGCLWAAAANAGFLSVTSGGSGDGNGSVSYLATANSGTAGQSGTLTIAGQTFSVAEAGIACSYSLSSAGASLTSFGGSGAITVTAPSGCGWSAAANAGFLSVTSGGSGNGTGTVSFQAAANAGVANRAGTLTIAGQTFTIMESGVACSYSLSSSAVSLSSSGGAGTVMVTAPSGCAWTASAAGFLSITSGAGGNGTGSVGYLAAANTGTSSETGTLTIAGQTFTVTESGLPTTTPFGSFDTPANNSTGVTGAIGFTGWAISSAGVATVGIWRESVASEDSSALVFLGNAAIVPGARPDVAAAYPGYVGNNSGWGYELLTNELPNANNEPGVGNGTYRFHVLVTDNAKQVVDLGTRTITVDNAAGVLPFGTIDTPAQGATVSGRYVNFGWAVTPDAANVIPVDGSTIWVFIDNLPVGHPVYNNYRVDIATLFPGLQNSRGAVGYFYIDTSTLSNGLHTIAWSVKDSAGNAQGLGSRYFNVQN